MSVEQRLGRGWSYPVAPTAGDLLFEAGAEKVRQSIWIILDTEPGERLMRPGFGCGLRRYLMKPNSSATRALIQHDVQRAIDLWEPRISLTGVRVDPGEDASLVLIRISYTHLRDSSAENLVYPFYLE